MTYVMMHCHLCGASGCNGQCRPFEGRSWEYRPVPTINTGSTLPPPVPSPPSPIFQGCICPPGANETCQNPKCPRKP